PSDVAGRAAPDVTGGGAADVARGGAADVARGGAADVAGRRAADVAGGGAAGPGGGLGGGERGGGLLAGRRRRPLARPPRRGCPASSAADAVAAKEMIADSRARCPGGRSSPSRAAASASRSSWLI